MHTCAFVNNIQAPGVGADLLKQAFEGLHLNELFISGVTAVLFIALKLVLHRIKQQLQIITLDNEWSCYSFSAMFSHCDGE